MMSSMPGTVEVAAGFDVVKDHCDVDAIFFKVGCHGTLKRAKNGMRMQSAGLDLAD